MSDAPQPKTFRDLALQVASNLYQEIHVNLSGLAFFGILGWGILHPADKDQCFQLAGLAGTYLFGAAKNTK